MTATRTAGDPATADDARTALLAAIPAGGYGGVDSCESFDGFDGFDAAAVREAVAAAWQRNGNRVRWARALARIPRLDATPRVGADGAVEFVVPAPLAAGRRRLLAGLAALRPWRKGPFRIAARDGVDLDAEWRCERKWARIAAHLPGPGPVLDIGGGNGWYAWRLLLAGHRPTVLEPTLHYAMQHLALARLVAGPAPAFVLQRDDALVPRPAFDAVLSMGVLYHQREPRAHLARAAGWLRPGGTLVLESIVLDAPGPAVLEPSGRYAGMRNVHAIPSVATAIGWLRAAGFDDVRCVDRAATTPAEQRPTRWSPGPSLQDVLSPADPRRTIEGLPAPVRAVIIATRQR